MSGFVARVGAATIDPDNARATRATVNLDVLAGNVRRILALLTPGTELVAVVKADGYGHGASAAARVALASGASRLAVATVGEGARLRRDGLRAPIVLLGAIDPGEASAALRLDLQPTVATPELLDAVAAAARALRLPGPAAVHVKVDTGMRRYGAEPGLAVALARRVAAGPALRLAGLSTHFATADEADERFTRDQAGAFDRVLADLADIGLRPERVHAANSAATLRSRRYDYDMVRVGIALYGLPPSAGIALPDGVRPALTVRSRVARVIALEPGDTVGYGRRHRATTPARAVLVPIGYADGYRRALSGRAWMALAGERVPVLGTVSMDQTVVGLPAGATATVGDEVVVLGGDGDAAPSAVDLADLLGTIPYEVVTSLAGRVPRHFLRGGVTVPADEVVAHGSALVPLPA